MLFTDCGNCVAVVLRFTVLVMLAGLIVIVYFETLFVCWIDSGWLVAFVIRN